MATIARLSAVASIGHVQVSGFLAWLLWLRVHLMYLVGFRNRLITLVHWTASFLGRNRSHRAAIRGAGGTLARTPDLDGSPSGCGDAAHASSAAA
jgi:hypothetical protein